MCVIPDVMFKVIEVEPDGHLTFGKQRLQLLHGYSVVLSIVEHKVANLQKSRANMQIVIT